ncbi:cytochrome c oxidase subunit 4 [Microbacterium aurantiacum]|uniref:cytochrome-c oxidase n=1 Tax=Microbacterium aurantiacum TaxID=162393 RepID=A0A0N0RRK3_9MICO|nr:cytochrome c oxidase subunit 4 [Microbacterium chocolatum]ANG85556.1 cytochrome c oxidase subunit IV [Microbacterium chocolatum]KOS11295.1 cytochrome c oxidase subunit IV [Microbacterium chocolatum]
MRTNTGLWWLLTVFSAVVAALYIGWNLIAHWPAEAAANPGADNWTIFTNSIEWVGSVALVFLAFMAALIAFYIGKVHKAQGGELPEDTLTADIDDGDPELGEFSPWSWWPIVLAASAGVAILGLAVGVWMFPIGVAIFLVAIVGWGYEYYRGYFAR